MDINPEGEAGANLSWATTSIISELALSPGEDESETEALTK